MNNLKWAIVVLVVIIITALIVKHFNKPTNTEITEIITPIRQKVDTLFIGDSIKALQQELLLTHDRKVIASLQDSLQRVVSRAAKIQPEVLIKYEQTFTDTDQIGKLKDSLSSVIDLLLAKSHESTITKEEFDKYKADVLASKIPYKIQTKHRYEVGRIDYSGNIHSDTLTITSEPTIAIGRKTGFLKRPTYAITVGDKNPLISQSNLSSIMYTPETKVQISAGPMVLTNGKDVAAGLGVTIKKGILSVSVGYQLVNTQNK